MGRRSRYAAASSAVALALCQLLASSLSAAAGPAFDRESRESSNGQTTTRVKGHPRTTYDWPYASGPFYGRADSRTPRLHTGVGEFDLSRGVSGLPEELTTPNRLDRSDGQYFVVQLAAEGVGGGVLAELRSIVEQNGGTIVHRMPETVWVVRLTAKTLAALEERSADLWAIEPYHAAFKLHPSIGRAPLVDPQRAVSEIYDLDIRLFPGEDAKLTAERIAKLGAVVSAVYPDTIRAELHRSKLAQLAQVQAVFMIYEHLPLYPQGEETTTTIQTGRYHNGATPFHDAGVDGGGAGIAAGPQVLMVLDTGIQLDAGDLSDTRVSTGTPGPTHRKVRLYESVDAFGGTGDLLGCDAAVSDGFTHGHMVAATALGNATDVAPAYGAGWIATDREGASWKLDGVAPGAVLVAYDAQLTPGVGSCGGAFSPSAPIAITPGDLYSGSGSGSLGQAYSVHDARVFNLSFGNGQNSYGANAIDLDTFLFEQPDALAFVAVGNGASDATDDDDNIVDPGSISAPATAKNILAIGAHRAANDHGTGDGPDERAEFSGVGPAVGNRIAPQLMAPGDEFDGGEMGLSSEFACRSTDNSSIAPVECDVISGLHGTSYASAAAAGAALLVRDYFAQGFYPDGTSANPGNDAQRVADISGALLRSVLIASAQFMVPGPPGEPVRLVGPRNSPTYPSGLTKRYRFNNEQGYGRIQLDNALPLQGWPAGATALRVADGGIDGGVLEIAGLDGTIDTTVGQIDSGSFTVCNSTDPIRVVLAWTEPFGAMLLEDLDLEVVSPTGVVYHGNYFTDDDDRDGFIDPMTEDCPSFDGADRLLDPSPWSLPVCERQDGTASPHDTANPTEAVFLSPDPTGDGTVNQIETGTWIVRVVGASGMETAQRYAVVIAGGLCQDSWVRLDREQYSCNGSLTIDVLETPVPGDPRPGEAEIGSRTTVEVLEDGAVVDRESSLVFRRTIPAGFEFRSLALPLSSGTARDDGNGALDVRHGDTIRVTYADLSDVSGTPDPDLERTATAVVDCVPRVVAGDVVIEQYGRDANFRLTGGCERNARNMFEYGFPDRYMDAGESLAITYAFASYESEDLLGTMIDLHCVIPDADSPAGCGPHSSDCADPRRSNNPSCDQRPSGGPGDQQYMTILARPRRIERIPSNSALAVSFGLEMASGISGSPEVEMLLSIAGETIGKNDTALTLTRHRLDVDEMSIFYSTDFPTGGMESVDVNNDELLDNPTTELDEPGLDYRFETRVWSDLTAGGTKNLALRSPWNFDTDDGGFRSGILASSDFATIDEVIAQWGEDLNFNGILDKRCEGDMKISCQQDTDCPLGPCLSLEDRDERGNGILDRSWNTRGGCGWQTRAPGSETGGIWHTGRIYGTVDDCLALHAYPCQGYEVLGGSSGTRSWREHLVTPPIQRVNGPDYGVEILDWSWNQAIELADGNVSLVWEFDTDLTRLEPVDLYSDSSVLNGLIGPFGAVGAMNNPDLTDGYSMFAPLDLTGNNWNGSLGNNRIGENACSFRGPAVDLSRVCPGCPTDPGDLGFAGPLDDEVDNDGDGQIDEYVTANGPIRNMDLTKVAGPDMRFDLLEDLYGETGEFFQASIGIWNFEKTGLDDDPRGNYGIGVDDMVIQWREVTLADDATSCTTGNCAVVYLQTGALDGNDLLTITVIETTPDPVNDCDLDGTPDGTDDCNGNGVPDLPVRVTSDDEPVGEIVFLDQGTVPAEFTGELPLSTGFDAPGILNVTSGGSVTAVYEDNNDGTGNPCGNSLDPAGVGLVTATADLFAGGAYDIRLISTQSIDNGDHDRFADTNETVSLRLRVLNQGDQDLTGVVARLSTNDPKIDCILQSSLFIGELASKEERLTDRSFVIRVADVDRAMAGMSVFDDFSADFTVEFSADPPGSNAPGLFTLDLDLDAIGGATPSAYFEGFEDISTSPYASLTPMNLDEGLNSREASHPYACTYSDPIWFYSQSYGVTDCFLGPNPEHLEAFFWQVHTPAEMDGGKAYSGSNSLYMGLFGPGPDTHTTPVSVLEAIRSDQPINLGADGAPSVLSFKHQVDFMDSKHVNVQTGRSPARGVVQAQVADPSGQPAGDWIKLYPFLNIYDTEAQDQYYSCSFDPIDDGNDVDSYFDPTDPDRRLGPSSTCFPEPNFVYQGDTFFPYDPERAALAESPGLRGSTGLGTWIEPRFDLSRFRGRRIRLRFLYTDLKAGGGTTWESLFQFNPTPGDDGWWIDDIQISNTLETPAQVVTDVKDNSQLPACGNTCNLVDAVLTADPFTALPAPGHVVELSAVDSIADRCLGGLLQFRFAIDGNDDGQIGGPPDTVVRSWSESAQLIQAPQTTTTYIAEVRCSSDPSCVDAAVVDVEVHCPSSGRLSYPTVFATDATTLDWGQSLAYDYAVGPLATLGDYITTDSGQNAGPASSFDTSAENPAAGKAFWYVFRQPGPIGTGNTTVCNSPGVSWGTPLRDSSLP